MVRKQLALRLASIERFARTRPKRTNDCPTNRYIQITGGQWGRTGNQIIAFTHGVWFADLMNATLIVPHYMTDIFTPFKTSLVSSLYCYTQSHVKKNNGVIIFEASSVEMFFPFILYKSPIFSPFMPDINDHRTILRLTTHFIQVYSSLWCCPHEKLQRAVEHLVSKYLDGNFRYSAVHIRSMEGGCR